MKVIKIKKGLNIPISNKPEFKISEKSTKSIGIVSYDYTGLVPTILIKIGDEVRKGQVIFKDKKNDKINFTAPASGKIVEINRGLRRKFLSLKIEVDNKISPVEFNKIKSNNIEKIEPQTLLNQLIEMGLWNLFLTRPLGKIPKYDYQYKAIFVNVMDTNPLAIDPLFILEQENNLTDFIDGLRILKNFNKPIYLCASPSANSFLKDIPDGINVVYFEGKHPAGLTGTHIHFIDRINNNDKKHLSINYQNLITIAKSLRAGILDDVQYIALAGPRVKNPRVIKTLRGANLNELCNQELNQGEYQNRIIAGSILGGELVDKYNYFLGIRHSQVCVLEEGLKRRLFGWLALFPNDRFSIFNIFLKKHKKINFDTSTNGSKRSIFPVECYEKVMPLDILPIPLLKYLAVGDIEKALDLGVLELIEEDLALCSFVCPGKYEYGHILRENLDLIEKEVL